MTAARAAQPERPLRPTISGAHDAATRARNIARVAERGAVELATQPAQPAGAMGDENRAQPAAHAARHGPDPAGVSASSSIPKWPTHHSAKSYCTTS